MSRVKFQLSGMDSFSGAPIQHWVSTTPKSDVTRMENLQAPGQSLLNCLLRLSCETRRGDRVTRRLQTGQESQVKTELVHSMEKSQDITVLCESRLLYL